MLNKLLDILEARHSVPVFILFLLAIGLAVRLFGSEKLRNFLSALFW